LAFFNTTGSLESEGGTLLLQKNKGVFLFVYQFLLLGLVELLDRLVVPGHI